MAITVHKELIDRITAVESNGIITAFTTSYLVEGISASSAYDLAQQAMNHADVPQPGDPHPENYNIGVVDRRMNLVEGNNSKVRIEVDYASWGSSHNLNQFVFNGGTNLQEVTASVDRSGTQVTVTHDGETQGVEFNPLFPQSTVSATGDLRMQYPSLFSQNWTGFINAYPWAGNAANTWLITGVNWVSVDASTFPRTFRFTIEFQHDSTGWQPEVVFIDPDTGRPPDGLVAGTGYKAVDWYPTTDFGRLFPV